MEEFGRALLPSPFHSTVLTFGLPVWFGGSAAQKAQYLPAITAGTHLGTLALTEPSASFEPSGISVWLFRHVSSARIHEAFRIASCAIYSFSMA
jgi:hypothetical protein